MKRIALTAVLAMVVVLALAGAAGAVVLDPDAGFYEAYQGSDTCGGGQICHQDIFESWRQTEHFALPDESPIPRGGNCASCHTTGFEPANDVIQDGITDEAEAVQPGQGCEACHGPFHWGASFAPNGDEIVNPVTGELLSAGKDVGVRDARDSETCGSCHGRHMETAATSPAAAIDDVEYPVGWLPGFDLNEFADIPAPVGYPGLDNQPAAPQGFLAEENFWTDYPSWHVYSHGGSGVQFQEYRQSRHFQIGIECADCHTVHTMGAGGVQDDPQVPTEAGPFMLFDEPFEVCASCHTDTSMDLGTVPSTPQVNMLNGEGGFGAAPLASPHNAFCTDCHMVPTGYSHSGAAGKGGNHLWRIVEPATANDLTTHIHGDLVAEYEINGEAREMEIDDLEVPMPNSSCSPCHGRPAGPATVTVQDAEAGQVQATVDIAALGVMTPALAHGQILQTRQDQIATTLASLNDGLGDIDRSALSSSEQRLYDQAVFNIRFVESDGSAGFHNYQYAAQLLFAAGNWLSEISDMDPPPPPPADEFPDVPSTYWAFEEIRQMAELGVVSGFGDGLFRPANPVFRAQLAKMVVELEGQHDPETDHASPGFPDVTPVGSEYPYDYVNEAAILGYVTGYADGTFRPYQEITRGQIAVILYRAFRTELDASRTSDAFTDIGGKPVEFQTAISILGGNGIVNGLTETSFGPDRTATRAQTAAMLFRIWEAFLDS